MDDTGGLIILEVENIEEATRLANADPAVIEKYFNPPYIHGSLFQKILEELSDIDNIEGNKSIHNGCFSYFKEAKKFVFEKKEKEGTE